jgi:hypothetical protein
MGIRKSRINHPVMKRLFFIAIGGLGLALLPTGRANAQLEIVGEIVKAAIMAIDLGVQKLQTQTILLQEAQKEAENLMQETQLADITGWVQEQKDLFQEYYNELWQVRTVLSAWQKVAAMIDKQAQLIADYKTVNGLIRQDTHFSAAEISHISNVYAGILSQSVENIDVLRLVIGSLLTQMDDGDRLRLIDAAGERIDQNYSDLRGYTQENILLSMQRAKDQADLGGIRALYGIP